jgi:hypothetical protein
MNADSHLPSFSQPARAFWEAIPERQRLILLANVWCGRCQTETAIVDYHGRFQSGNLILQGRCSICGGEVARLVEGR